MPTYTFFCFCRLESCNHFVYISCLCQNKTSKVLIFIPTYLYYYRDVDNNHNKEKSRPLNKTKGGGKVLNINFMAALENIAFGTIALQPFPDFMWEKCVYFFQIRGLIKSCLTCRVLRINRISRAINSLLFVSYINCNSICKV